MKKYVALLLAAVMAFSLIVMAPSAKADSLADLKSAGKLVIATSPDFPPFESLNIDDQVVGIEIEILEMICEKLGVKLEIRQMDFDAVLPGVQAGKFDMGVSGISVTEERQKNFLFTAPYCLAAQAIVVAEGSSITCKADLEGKTVSVQTGTTAETFCMSEGYNVKAFAANSEAEMAAVQGKVDAWVIDDLTGAQMVADYNKSHKDQLVVLDEPMTTEPYALAMAMGHEEVIAAVNEILSQLLEDGTIAAIFEKYEAPFTSPKA